MPTRTQSRKVLVLSDQPMATALLGMLLELEGYEPAFAAEGEGPEEALARVRPLLAVLLDQALAIAGSDLFLARAARRQVGIVLFGAQGAADGPPAWAQGRGIAWFRMPIEGAELRGAIEQATASFRLWHTDADRRRPRTETGADGTLIYHDRAGRRWHIYDRRTSDSGEAGARSAAPPAASGHRAFVNEAGEEWRVDMAAADFLDESPAGLEQQLARATRQE